MDISNALLQLKSIGISKIKEFEFMDPPEESAVDYGLSVLKDIGAINSEENITDRGK